MASFGVSAVDAGSMAAGVMNATAPAVAAAAGGIHRAAHVSAKMVANVRIAGNVFSLVALLVPLWTYLRPVCRAKGVGDRTIYSFVGVFFGALLWLLYIIPDEHRDTFTLTVNCLAMAVQVLYIVVYLKYAVGDNYDCSCRFVWFGAVLAISVSFFVVFVVLLSRSWSVKVVGITASTFGTAMFAIGIVDVVNLVKTQRSAFHILQLLANLIAACIWTSYAFLFAPVNFYVMVPNIAGVSVILVQIVFHAVHSWKAGNNQQAAAGIGHRA